MELELSINGVIESLEVAPNESLLTVLRRKGYYSVKHGCETGECGACAVLIDGVPRPSCVTLAAQAGGCSLTTALQPPRLLSTAKTDPTNGEKLNQPSTPVEADHADGNPLSGSSDFVLDHTHRLHPLQEAFIEEGAIQCGFCTPGMLLTASALLKSNPSPSEEEVRDALSGNLCRCTGYVKPVQAILRAAAVMRGEVVAPLSNQTVLHASHEGVDREVDAAGLAYQSPSRSGTATLVESSFPESSLIGQSAWKIDAIKLATGRAAFVDDIELRDLLYARILTSPHAHALIRDIDVSEARALPGVHAVLTYKDIPRIPFTSAGQSWPEPGPHDQYALDNRVRFVGDRVAAVAAETPEIAEQALMLIKVDYEVLPAIFDPRLATSDQAPKLHPEPESYHIHDAAQNIAAQLHAEVGDVERGFSQSDLIVEGEYVVPQVQQVPLENHIAITYWDEDERLVVRTSTQVPYHVRRIIAPVIGLPLRRIRVVKPRVGGSFGVKQEVVVEDLCALLTIATNHPVRLEYSRAEEFRSSRSRHAQIIRMKTGVKRDGTIVANAMTLIANTGAYGTHALMVQRNTGASTLPLYACPNMLFDAQVVYTNLPPAGAFRGYGVPQGAFALESHIDEVARQLGLDALELRRKNWLKVGSENALAQALSGCIQVVKSCGLPECLRIVEEKLQWSKKRGTGGNSRFRRGVGVALAMQGAVMPGRDMSAASIKLNEDGSFNLLVGASDTGNGSDTILAQIAAEVLGVRIEDILLSSSDTDNTPFDSGAYTSSTTYASSGATKQVAEDVRQQITAVAGQMLKVDPERISIRDRMLSSPDGQELTLSQVALYSLYMENPHQIMAMASWVGDQPPLSFAAQGAEVEVDTETGEVRVIKAISAIDAGRIINPVIAEGQIEGGAAQALGYGICEEMLYDSSGNMLTTDLNDYRILSAQDMPVMETYLVETEDLSVPFGAKEVADIPLDALAPALANAVADALGIRMRQIPLTPERILRAFRARNSQA
jgi:putative selenate reductase molybdopterin-binding subunit